MHPIRTIHPCLQLDPLDDVAAIVRSHTEIFLDDPAQILYCHAIADLPP